MRNLHETHDDLQLAQKNPESEEIKEKRVTYQQEKLTKNLKLLKNHQVRPCFSSSYN